MICYDLILNLNIHLNQYNINYIILKINNNFKMNLIDEMEYYQDKDHLVKYINVNLILINNIMQLKLFNLIKIILI